MLQSHAQDVPPTSALPLGNDQPHKLNLIVQAETDSDVFDQHITEGLFIPSINLNFG